MFRWIPFSILLLGLLAGCAYYEKPDSPTRPEPVSVDFGVAGSAKTIADDAQSTRSLATRADDRVDTDTLQTKNPETPVSVEVAEKPTTSSIQSAETSTSHTISVHLSTPEPEDRPSTIALDIPEQWPGDSERIGSLIPADKDMKVQIGFRRLAAPWDQWQADSSPSVLALQKRIDAIIADPRLADAHWGLLVKSLDNGRIIYSHQPRKGFMPASNLKIFTSAAGLVLLGEKFRYRTILYSTDPDISDGIIQGDLYVLGSGDPSFAARFHNGDALAPLKKWADQLSEMGIEKITGRIIGDDNIFDDQSLADGWSWDYLSAWYAAPVSGLSLNDNCLDVLLAPGEKVGDPVRAWTRGPSDYGVFRNQSKTIHGRGIGEIDVSRLPDGEVFEVRGRLSKSARRTIQYVSVENPTRFFVHQLKRLLEDKGIDVAGEAVDIDAISMTTLPELEKMIPLVDVWSPPLWKIVEAINRNSMNLYAEMLLKSIGRRARGIGSFQAGADAIGDFLENQGIDSAGFEIADGSGLSRLNLVQPYQMVAQLEMIRHHEAFASFERSLPVAGVNGTIAHRMKGGAARGNLRAKTGFIKRVHALSGYLQTVDGEALAFCIFVNQYSADKRVASRALDRICNELAAFSRKGDKALGLEEGR
ncbi:MAG: D-alanyl-D-alanine carboxypeptidase/D-alanyl-D-alanine-endopeptidase [Candidatus Sumerlaeia bacterium]